MATAIVSGGSLTSLELPTVSAPVYWPLGPPSPPASTGDVRRSAVSPDTYWYLWRTQPAVRTVVDFLARNVAQVGLHVFERISDEDRRRLRPGDHPVADAVHFPNPDTTQYRLLRDAVSDLCIFDVAFLAKVENPATGSAGLRRLSPRRTRVDVDAVGRPVRFVWRSSSSNEVLLEPASVVWLRGWTDLYADAVPPLETLRDVLDEDRAAVTTRRRAWTRGPRISGWIERPETAPDWTDAQQARFKSQFSGSYAGDGPETGGVPILEDGMVLHDHPLTPEQAQYAEVRKLTRAEAAAAYHVPPTMVGLVEGATYSNTREHHVMLYTDTLGPLFAMVEQDVDAQLVRDLDPAGNVYVEANIAEKLQGDFVEQSTALSTSVGAPFMTRSEARARLNLPHNPDADELVVPLNVLVGGQASPRDSTPPPKTDPTPALKSATSTERDRTATDRLVEAAASAFEEVFRGWGRTVAGAWGRKDVPSLDLIDRSKLVAPYAITATRYTVEAASTGAAKTLARYAPDAEPFEDSTFVPWSKTTAERAADGAVSGFLSGIVAAVAGGLVWRDALTREVDAAVGRSSITATSFVTPGENLGRSDAGKRAGVRSKVWRVTSGNPRPSCARMDGETVPMGETFSNGAAWPGDTAALSTDETAGCTCLLDLDE